jgi:hypothetical protein
MRTFLLLFVSVLAFAQSTPQFYVYFKDEAAGSWKWGRVILPPGAVFSPVTGAPCAGAEPCARLDLPATGQATVAPLLYPRFTRVSDTVLTAGANCPAGPDGCPVNFAGARSVSLSAGKIIETRVADEIVLQAPCRVELLARVRGDVLLVATKHGLQIRSSIPASSFRAGIGYCPVVGPTHQFPGGERVLARWPLVVDGGPNDPPRLAPTGVDLFSPVLVVP